MQPRFVWEGLVAGRPTTQLPSSTHISLLPESISESHQIQSKPVSKRQRQHPTQVPNFKDKCFPMLPRGTFHNLLEIWTNLTGPHGSWLQGGRMTRHVAPSHWPATEVLHLVSCEAWAWGRWLHCHTCPLATGCREPSLQPCRFLPGFCVKLLLPTSCSLKQRLGGPCAHSG